MADLRVANTIREQLGRAFERMTGASNFVGTDNGLSFKVMRNAFKVTHVAITLNENDLYDMEFLRIRGVKTDEMCMVNDVYFDDLHRQFRDHTGLETRMPMVHFR